jgi:hypothetical protein
MITLEDWVYKCGSDTEGHAGFGATVVHISTRTTLYTDATGCEKNRTIMRAGLVAIHTALARF